MLHRLTHTPGPTLLAAPPMCATALLFDRLTNEMKASTARMNAATSYASYRNAQMDYNEAREQRNNLRPAAEHRAAHEAWRDGCASEEYHSTQEAA